VKNIAAVILAAGQSKRMGQPKMLLPWGETTVLRQVLTTFAQIGVSEIVVVTGGAREAVEAEAARSAGKIPLRCVHNPDFEGGEMLSSVQAGLAALGPEVAAALIGLGDQPQLSLESARKVVAAAEAPGARLLVPSYNLRRGHPWLVERSLWNEILALQAPQTLRDFLNSQAGGIRYVEADQTILKDLDTPEDYQRERP
jgi:molybdenum cofactor cytidylyltransferase